VNVAGNSGLADGGALEIVALRNGAPGLTPALGGCLAEAASICLERAEHSQGVVMAILGDLNAWVPLSWEPTSDQMRRAWRDDDEATEFGACGIAALIVKRFRGLSIVERSVKGTGFDYWLGPEDDGHELFQRRMRLEVSGIGRGTDAEIRARVRQKERQTAQVASRLPAVIAVVEFASPQSRLIDRP
jgi:hypothetical protein